MPANLVAACKGRFQTRINRIVDIESSREVVVDLGAGRTTTKVLWTGVMYMADGKTVSGRHDWESSGNFVNQRGVANPNDLALMIRAAAPDPEPTPTLESSSTGAAMVDAGAPVGIAADGIAEADNKQPEPGENTEQ